MRKLKRAAAIIALLLCASASAQQASSKPKLVIVISIDQMRFDYLTRFADLYKGGFRTLLDKGAVFSNAYYRHAATETGPGHSVLLTGRHPSHSGIVANEWWDSYLKKYLNVVEDPVQSAVGGDGRGASPANLLAFTVGDVLKRHNLLAHVVGLSLKDRSAILMGGRRADAAYWYETAGGNFVTSTYYMNDAPTWLVKWNSRHLADQYAGHKWTRLLPDERIYEKYAGPDSIQGEWDRKDIVFPHVVRGNPPEKDYYDDLRRNPVADELTLSAALEALKAHHLGEDSVTDIFAVGFSATDVIGHTYGPDSQEIMDQLLRLDLVLDRLFKEIDSKIGLENTLVVLSADHGVQPLVENLQAKGIDARRATPSVLETAVRAALKKRFPGVPDLIAHFDTDFYFNEEVIREHRLDRRTVEQTAISALRTTGLVERVYTPSDLMSDAPSSDPYLRFFRNSFFQPRSPHLIVLLKKYVYMSDRPGGTGHGTPYEHDRHVPVVFWGRNIKPGMYAQDCGPEDIAPTLAKLLGLELAQEPDARILAEMIK